jgi:hypothetical protein
MLLHSAPFDVTATRSIAQRANLVTFVCDSKATKASNYLDESGDCTSNYELSDCFLRTHATQNTGKRTITPQYVEKQWEI